MDFQSFISGSLGGFTAQIASYPFDTIKVRMQDQNILYKGVFDCLVKSAKKESVWSLYRGMSSPVVGSMFINSVLFGVDSNARKFIQFESQVINLALCGAIAGFAQGTLLTPIEVVKIHMQVDNSKYRSTFECVKDLTLTKGLKSFTRGFYLTVYREIPGCAVYFTSFELLTREKSGNKASLWQLLIAGGTAGCLSWLITYPIDTIKTKFQTNDAYKSILECIIDCFKNEGYKGFWKGLSAALLRSFPNNAACLTTVTIVDRFIMSNFCYIKILRIK